jgi:hypothetical protein
VIDHEWHVVRHGTLVTDFIDRYFVSDPMADSLPVVMLVAAFAQGAFAVGGFVLAWHAIECGLTQHHGHAIICTVGVVIAIYSFDIAAQTWKRAQTARQGSRLGTVPAVPR